MRNTSFKWWGLACLVTCVLFLSGPNARAQNITGAILGTVKDSSGAVVPDAEATVTNTATKQSRVVKSDTVGFYDAEALPAGTYDVTVRKEGFQTYVVQGVVLDASARVSVDATLQVGTPITEVKVTASPVRVELETGESSGVITGEHLQKLLLNGRNYFGLALLVPGVNLVGKGGNSLGGGNNFSSPVSINGVSSQQNHNTIDGVSNNNTGSPEVVELLLPLDTIGEFRIVKDNYSARFGTSGSAQIQVDTKSGSQTFHGSAYDYLRNDALDASNFFVAINPVTRKKLKNPLKQNIFGFAVGGPLYIPGKYNTEKKKTFFFVNEEWRRRRAGLTLRGAMFPLAMRNGDFTGSPTLGAGGLKLDSVATQFLSQLYPGVNCLPDSTHLNPACFDQNAVTLMNQYWPLPNNPGGGFLNYINPGVLRSDQRNDTYRIDHYFNEKYSLMARFSYQDALDTPPAVVGFGGSAPNPAPTTQQTSDMKSISALLKLTGLINPKTVNTISIAYSSAKAFLDVFGADLPTAVKINYPFPDALKFPSRNHIPVLSISGGWAGLTDQNFPFHPTDGHLILTDDFSKVIGTHVLQAGVQQIWGIERIENFFISTSGSFSFSGIHTNDPAADYLLGLDSSFSQASRVPRHYDRYQQLEAYFQDDWKMTPRLTLNLGLRYLYDLGGGEKIEGNAFSDFNPSNWDPSKAPQVTSNGVFVLDANRNPLTKTGAVADVLNGLVFPGKNGVPETINVPWKGAFMPRLGFAWDVFGNGKTSLRGGYGIGYTYYRWGDEFGTVSPPWVGQATFLNGTLTNPSAGSPGAKSPPSINWVGPPGVVRRPTMLQNWSLGVERQVSRGGVFSVAYVGSRATHMPANTDYNFPSPVSAPSIANPNCLQPGQTIPATGFNFDPCLNKGLVSSSFTRPFVGYGSITQARGASGYGGRLWYNSLQSGFKYKARHLTLNFAYTWSKDLQDTGQFSFGSGAQDPRNFRANYGVADQDRTHIFTSGYVYDLPFLRERKDLVGKAFGNWAFSGITVIESGGGLTPSLASGTNGLATRPNCVGNLDGPHSVTQWFNTAAFARPAFGFFGNCGKGVLRGPGENTWNWAFFKTFPIGERAKLEFRSEFFNIWNHVNFNGISTSFGAGNFGRITSAADERQIEFVLRLEF